MWSSGGHTEKASSDLKPGTVWKESSSPGLQNHRHYRVGMAGAPKRGFQPGLPVLEVSQTVRVTEANLGLPILFPQG